MLWEDNVLYNLDQACRLVIETFGDRLLAYLDNVLLFDIQDTSITAGQVGFYCWRNTKAHFEDLQVESLEAPPVLWHPLFINRDDLETVDEKGSIGGPSNWNTNSGVLVQSSNIYAKDGTWQRLQPGLARDIGVGADGSTWIIGTNPVPGGYGIYRWNGSGWDSIPGGGGGIGIAVASDGNPWVVNDAQQIFRWDGTRWWHISGSGYDIGAGFLPCVIWTDSAPGGYNVYRFNGMSWENLGGGAVRIAVTSDGNPWVVNDAQQIFRWDGFAWQSIPGSARDVGVGADGSTWIIGTNPVPGGYGIYRWNGLDWEAIDGGGGGIGIAVASDGNPWVVNDAQQIFRWDGSVAHKPGTYALSGNPAWTDVQISVQLQSNTNGALGVMFRYVDLENYYRFSIHRQGNYRRLIKKVKGKISTLWEDQVQYSVGQSYDLTIRVIGGWIKVYLDGISLFELYDTDLKYGRVGLYCQANAAARFGPLLVKNSIPQVGRWIIREKAQAGETPSLWRIDNGELVQTSMIKGNGTDPAFPALKLWPGVPIGATIGWL